MKAMYQLNHNYTATARAYGVAIDTVRKYVNMSESEIQAGRKKQARKIDPFLEFIEQQVLLSKGYIQARALMERLVVMGYTGSERTLQRAVKECKEAYYEKIRRIYKPVIATPGSWVQYDYGDGPVIGGKKTVLFVAWLPWSKYRFVMPLWDKTMPSVTGAIETMFRHLGGVPERVLTDNERTVTIQSNGGYPVFNKTMLDLMGWFNSTIEVCVPYDPQSKGGVERAVRVAKDDLVPKRTNLRAAYDSFAALQAACDQFMVKVNTRKHAAGFIPAERLAQEQPFFLPLPEESFVTVFGASRKVTTQSLVRFQNREYSVPTRFIGSRVQARFDHVAATTVISAVVDGENQIVAVHPQGKPGEVLMEALHYPKHHPRGPVGRKYHGRSKIEKAFFNLGDGAHAYAKAAGRSSEYVTRRFPLFLELAKTHGSDRVNRALAKAAETRRFTIKDVTSILTHPYPAQTPVIPQDSDVTFAQGTSVWESVLGGDHAA